jgi:HD superfamily phosphohydrolase
MILRDPVHGLVAFENDEERIVDALMPSRELQRLRRVRQLGFTSLSYPGADHTRFSHSVGAAHVMTRFLKRLRDLDDQVPFWQRATTERAREALAAALLHDLGHGPFSHLFEEAWPEAPSHEDWSSRILLDSGTDTNRILSGLDPSLPRRVADLVHGKHEVTFLARAVSGTFDVDRCDYLLRDAHFTGVGYGRFDLEWLLRSLRLGDSEGDKAPPLAIDGPKGLPAIESFVLARLFMFQQVYFHKASRASEWMLQSLLGRAKFIILNGRIPERCPAALVDLSRTNDTTLGNYLELDDMVIWEALRAWQADPDPILSDLSTRLFSRSLFKTYEFYGEQLSDLSVRAEGVARVQEIARAQGFDPTWYVGLDVATDTPFDDADAGLTVLFPNGRHRAPAEVSLLLRRLSGEAIERVRLVFPRELRSAVIAALEN